MIDKDKEEAAKEATLIREGFSVVGSMENPPTNETRMKAVEQELQHLEKKYKHEQKTFSYSFR